jgi:predicted transcriptional regulator
MQEKYSNIITEFLKSRYLISVNALEHALNIPQSTIGKALQGERLIPEKHIFPIICFLAEYGLKIDGYDLSYDESNGTLFGRTWVETVSTEEEGDGFVYLIKEYRFTAGNYFDLR